MILADALNEYLKKSGKSRRALSLRAGMNEKSVSDILNAPGLKPRKATLVALSEATGIDLGALLPGKFLTYADLISEAEREGNKAFCSRLRWLCRHAGWAAELTPACKQDVIDFFDRHTSASFSLGRGSFATYRSTLIKAVGSREPHNRARRIDDIDGLYRQIHQLIRVSDLPMSLRLISGSFLLFLHDRQIMPHDITSRTLGDYYRHRLDTSSRLRTH